MNSLKSLHHGPGVPSVALPRTTRFVTGRHFISDRFLHSDPSTMCVLHSSYIPTPLVGYSARNEGKGKETALICSAGPRTRFIICTGHKLDDYLLLRHSLRIRDKARNSAKGYSVPCPSALFLTEKHESVGSRVRVKRCAHQRRELINNVDKLIHQRLKVGDESATPSTLSSHGVVCGAILKIERGDHCLAKKGHNPLNGGALIC